MKIDLALRITIGRKWTNRGVYCQDFRKNREGIVFWTMPSLFAVGVFIYTPTSLHI